MCGTRHMRTRKMRACAQIEAQSRRWQRGKRRQGLGHAAQKWRSVEAPRKLGTARGRMRLP